MRPDTRTLPRFVSFGDASYQWGWWNGENLSPKFIALDCETVKIEEDETPNLVLLAAFDGTRCWIVRPHDVGFFLSMVLRSSVALFWNAAFDVLVLDRHFAERGDTEARGWLWSAIESDCVRDAMILSALTGIARQDNFRYFAGEKDKGPSDRPAMPGLGDFAEHTLGARMDKDEYRLRYSEIRYEDWEALPAGWFEYPCRDVIATFQAYSVVSHDAKSICDAYSAGNRFGFLGEHIITKSAIALGYVGHRGFRVDKSKVAELVEPYENTITEAIDELPRMLPGFFKTYKVKARKGELMLNVFTGLPRMDQKVLQAYLESAEQTLGIKVERTTRGISTSTKVWDQYRERDALVDLWCRYKDAQKKRSFLHDLPDHVRCRYGLVRSGRTNSYKPYLQQHDKAIRDTFVPEPGGLFLIIDVASAELVALAVSCIHRFGFSQLGETLKQGIDPHAFMASRIMQKDYEAFMALKETDKATFKRYRALAKAANFGLGGGLGAPRFVELAGNPPYKLKITEQEALAIKEAWLSTFPEMRQHLTATTETLCNKNGRVRGGMTYCAARNYPFQSLVADGQRLAVYELVRQGYQVSAFIHDEVVITIDRVRACSDYVKRIEWVITKAMEDALGNEIPIRLESGLCDRWSKRAEPVFDENGELIPWEDAKHGN